MKMSIKGDKVTCQSCWLMCPRYDIINWGSRRLVSRLSLSQPEIISLLCHPGHLKWMRGDLWIVGVTNPSERSLDSWCPQIMPPGCPLVAKFLLGKRIQYKFVQEERKIIAFFVDTSILIRSVGTIKRIHYESYESDSNLRVIITDRKWKPSLDAWLSSVTSLKSSSKSLPFLFFVTGYWVRIYL